MYFHTLCGIYAIGLGEKEAGYSFSTPIVRCRSPVVLSLLAVVVVVSVPAVTSTSSLSPSFILCFMVLCRRRVLRVVPEFERRDCHIM